jgi:hypothetical protein
MEGLCEPPTCNRIFLPPEDNPFLGETSMCRDTTLARQYLFSSFGDDVTTNWWQLLWITGFLSKILIKVVATNFCINMYYLADPLSSCGGCFEWPPGYLFRGNGDAQTGTKGNVGSGMSPNEAAKLRQRKTNCLYIISFKWAVVWGILTHLCLLNLALASIENEAAVTADIIVASIFFCVAVTSIIVLIGIRCFLRHHDVNQNKKPKDSMKPHSLQRSKKDERASPLLETMLPVPPKVKDEDVEPGGVEVSV